MDSRLTRLMAWGIAIQMLVVAAAMAAASPAGRAWSEGIGAPWLPLAIAGLAEASLLVFVATRIYLPLRRLEKIMQEAGKGNMGKAEALSKNGGRNRLIEELHTVLRDHQAGMKKKYEADLLKQQAEISAMQSQINPHFLYNVFDSIRGHALMEDVPEIAEMTEALSVLFRYSVGTRSNIVSLGSELNNVENYFKIQQYRFSSKFTLDIHIVDGDPAVLDCRVPKLMLQPIVENAIYHGLETKMERGWLKIRIMKLDDRLRIIVSDNGAGIKEDDLDAINRTLAGRGDRVVGISSGGGTGIALTNVNSRIKLQFGDAYGIYLRSMAGEGTDVEITLPFTT